MTELAAIRKERQAKAHTYSQAEAAKVLGVSRPHYIELEKDPKRLTAEQISKLADYFDMAPEEIFFICRGM